MSRNRAVARAKARRKKIAEREAKEDRWGRPPGHPDYGTDLPTRAGDIYTDDGVWTYWDPEHFGSDEPGYWHRVKDTGSPDRIDVDDDYVGGRLPSPQEQDWREVTPAGQGIQDGAMALLKYGPLGLPSAVMRGFSGQNPLAAGEEFDRLAPDAEEGKAIAAGAVTQIARWLGSAMAALRGRPVRSRPKSPFKGGSLPGRPFRKPKHPLRPISDDILKHIEPPAWFKKRYPNAKRQQQEWEEYLERMGRGKHATPDGGDYGPLEEPPPDWYEDDYYELRSRRR